MFLLPPLHVWHIITLDMAVGEAVEHLAEDEAATHG